MSKNQESGWVHDNKGKLLSGAAAAATGAAVVSIYLRRRHQHETNGFDQDIVDIRKLLKKSPDQLAIARDHIKPHSRAANILVHVVAASFAFKDGAFHSEIAERIRGSYDMSESQVGSIVSQLDAAKGKTASLIRTDVANEYGLVMPSEELVAALGAEVPEGAVDQYASLRSQIEIYRNA